MKRAELRYELERLGTRPVPMPDHHRLEAIEQRLLQEFEVSPVPSARSASARSLEHARRRRRQVLVAGLGAAAAAVAVAAVVSRGGTPGFELQAATGAVALFPDGDSRAVQAGDRVPVGGLIHTGRGGSLTIDDTTVGADQFVLLDDKGITLLPAPPETVAPAVPPATAPATAGTAPGATQPSGDPRTSAPAIVPTPLPAAAADPAPLGLVLTEDAGGVQLSWTASDAESFDHYSVVRGNAEDGELSEIITVRDRTTTQFTDPSAPHGVEVLYQVVAVGTDGLPVGRTEVMALTVEGTGGSEEVPPSTDPPPTSEPEGSTTTTTAPEPTTTTPTDGEPGGTAPPGTTPTTNDPAAPSPPTDDLPSGTTPTTGWHGHGHEHTHDGPAGSNAPLAP